MKLPKFLIGVDAEGQGYELEEGRHHCKRRLGEERHGSPLDMPTFAAAGADVRDDDERHPQKEGRDRCRWEDTSSSQPEHASLHAINNITIDPEAKGS